jgi:hypothetical protein
MQGSFSINAELFLWGTGFKVCRRKYSWKRPKMEFSEIRGVHEAESLRAIALEASTDF